MWGKCQFVWYWLEVRQGTRGLAFPRELFISTLGLKSINRHSFRFTPHVWGYVWPQTKLCHPAPSVECFNNLFCCSRDQWISFWPSSGPVHHDEEVSEATGKRKGPTRSTSTWSRPLFVTTKGAKEALVWSCTSGHWHATQEFAQTPTSLRSPRHKNFAPTRSFGPGMGKAVNNI